MGRSRIPTRQLPKNINPKGTRCITFIIPDDDEWEQIAYSTLYDQLALVWMNWQRTGDDTGSRLCRRWRAILRTWRHCKTSPDIVNVGLEDDMPFFRQVCEDGKCYLEFECCPGEWIRLANGDQIVPPGQPGAGADQPASGGGTANYCSQFQANGKFYLPTVVNSGDIISIQSATGAGTDNSGADWFCPDGSVFFAGFCAGGGSTSGLDPVPSVNHMALIINVGGSFYGFSSGSFTVPGGVTNASAFLQANTPSITSNSGSYDVCVQVTNNQASTWGYDANFLLSDNGWSVAGSSGASWSPGQGWLSATTDCIIGIHLLHTSTVTKASFTYTWDNTDPGAAAATAQWKNSLSIPNRLTLNTLITPGGTDSFSGSQSPTDWFLGANTDGAHPPVSPGSIKIVSCHFEGTGTNPFIP